MSISADRARSMWGAGDLDAHFHGGVRAAVPWVRAPKHRPGPAESARHARLIDGLRRPVRLVDVDPRNLLASQPMVVRHHARYYLGDKWAITGATSADMAVTANRFPVIELGERDELIIRTGHHRALAALLLRRQLLARVVDTRVGDHDAFPEPAAISITPMLSLLDNDVVGGVRPNGCATRVTSRADATAWMSERGLDGVQIRDRLAVSEGRPAQLDR